MTDMIRVPWTPEQVAALNAFQQRGGMHPFTCGGEHAPGSPALVAYADGWRCPQPYGEHCDYRQDWAHAFMADPSAWPKPPFAERHGSTPGEMRRATLIDTEVRKQLHAVIKALGASETENKQLRAAITRTRAYAQAEQSLGNAITPDDLLAVLDEDQAPAASCSPATPETGPDNSRTTPDNPPTSSDWTPPPPGDRREQLPDAILALLDIPPYTSTACETAELLATAIARHPEHADELQQWEQRQRQRCRINNKYTGVICQHAAPEDDLRERLHATIESEMYEYRERTMFWPEGGVTTEIARLATRGALEALGTPAPAQPRDDTAAAGDDPAGVWTPDPPIGCLNLSQPKERPDA